MFDALKILANKVKKLNSNKLIKQALSNSSIQHDIIDLNKIEQLYEKGIDSKGDSLGEYSPSTVNFWKPLAAAEGRDGKTDNITLKDTGAFYESFIFKNSVDNFEIQADTLKEGTDLQDAFGKEILGLTDENKIKVAEWLVEPLKNVIRTELKK